MNFQVQLILIVKHESFLGKVEIRFMHPAIVPQLVCYLYEAVESPRRFSEYGTTCTGVL